MNEWRLNYINGKPFPKTIGFNGVQRYRIAAECNGYVLGVTEKGNCAVWSGGYHANGELREVSGGSYFTGVDFGSSPEKCFESAFALFAERASGGKVASVEETRLDVLKGMNENIDSVELDWNETLIAQGSKELGKTIRSVDYEHPSVSDVANRTEIKTYYEHDGNYFVVTQETDDLADVHSSSCESITFDDMINAFVDAKEYGDKFDEERGILHDSVSCHIFDEQLKDDVKQVYENREQSEELDLTQEQDRGRS